MTNHDKPAIGAVGEGIDWGPVLGNPDPYLDALVDVPQAECAVGTPRGQDRPSGLKLKARTSPMRSVSPNTFVGRKVTPSRCHRITV